MKKYFILAVILLILLSAIGLALYSHHPLYQVFKINPSIHISGIKLLMPLEEVKEKIGEGEYLYGMGAYGYEYEQEKVEVFYSNDSDGLSYHKVSSIVTRNPKHTVIGIQIGASLDKAYAILEESGFQQQEEKNYYKKGDIYVILTHDYDKVREIQIGFIDRRIAHRVY